MKKNQKRLITLVIAMAAAPLYAASLSEIEANHPITTSQYLNDASNHVQINAAIGTVGATETVTMKGKTFTVPASTDDNDFYSFYAKAGDVITLDIDNGVGGQQSVDTILGLFDSEKKLLRMNDNPDSLDSGSDSISDARIDNFVVPATGVYYVGVSGYPRFFQDGGGNSDTSKGATGDYALNILGVSPPVEQVSIEIRPGNRELAVLNPKSNGKIPVAILSSSKFNAMDVNPSSLTFGSTGSEASLSKCLPGQDVNRDGLVDLVCHFENLQAGFKTGDLEGVLQGRKRNGMGIEGRGLLKVIPGKAQ